MKFVQEDTITKKEIVFQLDECLKKCFKMLYLRSSNFMVPVPLSLNYEAFGLAVPFGNPNEAPLATAEWDPDGA